MGCLTFCTTPLGRVVKSFDPPQPPLKRGENSVKVPLFKGDLGGSKSDGEAKKTRPSPKDVLHAQPAC